MISVKYNNTSERLRIIQDYEAKGYTMRNDTFAPDWHRGLEPFGIMQFEKLHSENVIEKTVIKSKGLFRRILDKVKL